MSEFLIYQDGKEIVIVADCPRITVMMPCGAQAEMNDGDSLIVDCEATTETSQ